MSHDGDLDREVGGVKTDVQKHGRALEVLCDALDLLPCVVGAECSREKFHASRCPLHEAAAQARSEIP